MIFLLSYHILDKIFNIKYAKFTVYQITAQNNVISVYGKWKTFTVVTFSSRLTEVYKFGTKLSKAFLKIISATFPNPKLIRNLKMI